MMTKTIAKKFTKTLFTISTLCSVVLLSACANVNDKNFNGNTYSLEVAELSGGNNLFTYINKSNQYQTIFVQTQNIPTQLKDTFAEQWIQKEQSFRINDCVIEEKNVNKSNYYLCDFKNNPAQSIYVIDMTDNNRAVVKIFVTRDKKMNLNEEQKIVEELNKFSAIP